MDKSTLTGITLAFCGIVGGLLFEGGRVSQVLQPTAALIVFGGTLGAVLVQFPLWQFVRAVSAARAIFVVPSRQPESLISELVGFANKARKRGILSLDSELPRIRDPFLKKSLMLAVDGTPLIELRAILESELEHQVEVDEGIPQVFEAAGGFSPTVGILGAVLGLIQVMQHLQNIDEVGKGIAVAFVATIYGVAAANLLFLPAAGKLRIRLREAQMLREMTVEGVISLLEGINPRILQVRLHGFLSAESLLIADGSA